MSDVKPVGFVQKTKLERLVSGYSVVAALYKDNFADEVPIYSQATIDALQAEIEAMRKDARYVEYGRVAMRFVDRAGDVHPGIDDAETICAEFHEAMSKAVDAAIAK